jgi:hypothetical protein
LATGLVVAVICDRWSLLRNVTTSVWAVDCTALALNPGFGMAEIKHTRAFP